MAKIENTNRKKIRGRKGAGSKHSNTDLTHLSFGLGYSFCLLKKTKKVNLANSGSESRKVIVENML